MNTNIISITNKYLKLSYLKENISKILTSQQKKILLIASAIIGCMAIGYAIYRSCLMKRDITRIENEKGADEKIKGQKENLDKVMNIYHQSFPIEQESTQIPSDVDEDAFNQYLFSHPKLLSQNKTLLEQTVCQATCLSTDISYHHFELSAAEFEQLLDSVPTEKVNGIITCVEHWFDYLIPNHFFIDFAHATSFGGAYRSYGCVQEERMFAEFRALAILDFKTKNGIHPCIDSYAEGGHSKYPPNAKPHPFIIEGIERQFDISKAPYGGNFQKATQEAIIKGIVKVEKPVPVNIIGLAAVDWRGVKNPKYKLEDLIYHFEAAYLANRGAKQLSEQRGWSETVVHTAPWGCGAFLNSEKMITALQYLAAHTADVDLVFHGVGNPMNPHYTQDDIDQTIQYISQLVQEEKSIRQILEILLEKSQSDPTWSPK